mmetsp:Transcript_2284/g.6126  ORF Transcript_2284/g.6126 Transcript_2284/m.6126 type:complete len:234 (+) Transcript_2284:391-1092(+)
MPPTTSTITADTNPATAAAAATTAAAAGATKKAKAKKKPTTILDKIVAAVRALRDPGPKGSSRQSIARYLRSELGVDNPKALKRALRKGVDGKVLVQTGQSFRVAGDPIVSAPEEDESERLVVEDLVAVAVSDDDGATTAEPGDAVTVGYVGTLEDGSVFDRASRFTFVLGAGEVIKGWDRGLESMRVGGKRRLVVPSKLGYGKRGCKPDIPPNATLRFTVTLKGVKKGPMRG